MREERGKLNGDVVIDELYTLWGMIVGNVEVLKEGKLYLRGSIYGDLTVQSGGRAHIFGNVQGRLTAKRGAKVIHSGVVGGDIVNQGGRIYIELMAKTLGKVKTKDGKTTFEEREKFPPE
ncbi:MAG TPA: polymer-forming cytoskeletal protein [Tepidisphaeraceae bacterium]|jgi:cytoskeletal protein CcmA (bactofilin family)|nr:polymer-forming cytoskeletal protein [Tepidisphaeraceae bacterium]